jgi:hypothetical protein
MDFLDPKKQRAHRIRLFVGYALMAFVISVTALLLVFQAYGYNFNLQTGDITQNGIVFVDAHPEAAEVYINGQLKGTTDRRLILPANHYTLELRRAGYRTWQRQFTLMGGKIERFVYPFLFPEELVTKEVQLYASAPGFASQSPDRRWLVVREPNAPFTFSLVDLNSEIASSVTLALPPNLFNQACYRHDIQTVEWSSNNRHVVLKHSFEQGSEFVLVDREEPALSSNLTRLFADHNFTGIALRDKRFDRYYLHDQTTKTLKSAELQTRTATVVLGDVLQFQPHGDDVLLYITSAGAAEGRVLVRMLENNEAFTLLDFPVNSRYLIDIARFENKWYVVAGAAADQKIYVLRDPTKALRRNPGVKLIPAATLRLDDAQFVSFSTNARFIAAQSGSRFAVYDAETASSYRYDSGHTVTGGHKAVWMDGHRLALSSNNKVQVFDYDGTNSQSLSAGFNGLPPYFDRDYTAQYSFANSQIQGRAALLRTELRVAPR